LTDGPPRNQPAGSSPNRAERASGKPPGDNRRSL